MHDFTSGRLTSGRDASLGVHSTAIASDKWLDLKLHLRAGAAWTGAAEPQLTAAAVDGD